LVYLVRHAESSGGPGDPGLSEQGRFQANLTARHFASVPLSAVFSSPLQRARDTAVINAADHGVPVNEDIRLQERVNWGDRGGQSRENFVDEWEAASADRNLVLPGGSSSRATGDNVIDFCRSQPPGARIVAVTHGGAIGDCLLNLMSRDDVKRRLSSFPEMEPCSITILRLDGGDIFADVVGSAVHLYKI
jgi:broad specificity phosphatase PhoE